MSDKGHIDPFLKREFDRLLTENQELHTTLRRLDRVPALSRRLARLAVRAGRVRFRKLVPSKRRSAEEGQHRAEFAASFRPYEVQQLPPISDRRPRVLHAIANFYTGGSPRLVVDLVEGLADRFEHVTIVRDNPSQPHYVGLELHAVPHIRDSRAALTLLRRLRPDLIHVHFLGHHQHPYSQRDWEWYDSLFDAAGAYGCPVIENINIPVAPYFSECVSCYVFVSDYVRKIFGREGDRNLTIYPGSNFGLFSRRELAEPPDGCVGMVYRLEKDKLDETTIDVFVEVLRRRPGTRALIVGGGRFLDSYRRRVDEAGLADSVTFTAYVAYDDLPHFYEQMSIFVAPPHWESFGHVVPLAMNMGIPVAAYAIGALPEILGDDEALVPAGDVHKLAAKVVELLDDRDRRLRLGEANRDRARRLFSLEKMIADYRALYDELLGPAVA
jgi:glycosyltransferase involved in cell wall biosynthesis